MPGTYKTIELVGTSPVSFTEAVKALPTRRLKNAKKGG